MNIQSSDLDNLATNANEVLLTAKTLFPFTLFPDTIIVDRVKMTVCHRTFFRVAETFSIQIEDMLNVMANTGPFFGSLKIWTRFFINEPYVINYLSREDTLHIQQILQGYIIARNQHVDTDSVRRDELIVKLNRVGEDKTF